MVQRKQFYKRETINYFYVIGPLVFTRQYWVGPISRLMNKVLGLVVRTNLLFLNSRVVTKQLLPHPNLVKKKLRAYLT